MRWTSVSQLRQKRNQLGHSSPLLGQSFLVWEVSPWWVQSCGVSDGKIREFDREWKVLDCLKCQSIIIQRWALKPKCWGQVTVWRLGLENLIFYLPDILSRKIEDNPEMSMVLRFRIILNVRVRIRIRVRIRVKVMVLFLTIVLNPNLNPNPNRWLVSLGDILT